MLGGGLFALGGSSWRIGVDPDERTELVTDGIFRFSRNPIYVFMVVAWLGFGLLSRPRPDQGELAGFRPPSPAIRPASARTAAKPRPKASANPRSSGPPTAGIGIS